MVAEAARAIHQTCYPPVSLLDMLITERRVRILGLWRRAAAIHQMCYPVALLLLCIYPVALLLLWIPAIHQTCYPVGLRIPAIHQTCYSQTSYQAAVSRLGTSTGDRIAQSARFFVKFIRMFIYSFAFVL